MLWWQFLVYGIAIWRLYALIAYDDGPFQIIKKLRDKVGVLDNKVTNSFAKLFMCVYCSTIWYAGGLLLIINEFNVAYVLALSGIAILIQTWLDRDGTANVAIAFSGDDDDDDDDEPARDLIFRPDMPEYSLN